MPQIAVYGWAFVVVDSMSDTVAEAAGAAPSWVRTMGEAEAWALVRAAQECPPGATFVTDCSSVATQVAVGRARATAPTKPMARVMRMLHTLLDDAVAREAVVWMPSHCTAASAMGREKGNGSPVTELDRAANGKAELLAKAQARAIRTPAAVRAAIAARRILAIRVALHVGRATWTACSAADGMARDTTAVSRPVRRDGHIKSASGSRRPPRWISTGLSGPFSLEVIFSSVSRTAAGGAASAGPPPFASRALHIRSAMVTSRRGGLSVHTRWRGRRPATLPVTRLPPREPWSGVLDVGPMRSTMLLGWRPRAAAPPRGAPTLGGTIASRGSGKGGILRTGLPSVTRPVPLPVGC